MKYSTQFLTTLAAYAALAAGCSISSPALSAEPAAHEPIFVTVFWLKPNSEKFDIVSIDLGGIVQSAAECAALPISEVAKHTPHFAAKARAGLIPKIVCGIAAPSQDTDDPTSDDQTAPDVRSEPGHPDSSGVLPHPSGII